LPFTPFHWGPSLLIGLVFFPLLNIPILIVSSVIVDIEPLLMNLQHLFFHSYLGATIAGVLVAALAVPLKRNIEWISTHLLFLPQKATFKNLLATSLFGVWLHVFFDSFLYPEMQPFFPLAYNPFLFLISSATIYEIVTWAFVPALGLYLIRIYLVARKKKAEEKKSV
jgi:membrane-bound metal-dependent hydrolase YbcI (DUF457 family)